MTRGEGDLAATTINSLGGLDAGQPNKTSREETA